MSYDNKEISLFEAFPVELYIFNRAAQSWRYTSADEDKVIGSILYPSAQIKRPRLEQTQEMSRSPITLNMDKTIEVLGLFKKFPPSDIIQLTIQRYHEGDGELTTPWVGRVLNVKFLEEDAEVRCEPVYTSLRRPTLRRRYQTTCPHVLYGAGCNAVSADFRVDAVLETVSGLQVTASTFGGFADGYFSGGYFDWEVGGTLERRFITNHVGNTLTQNIPLPGLATGANVRVYPGCDHTMNTCFNKFNNVDNYGGQPFYPGKNPMGGSPIF